MGNIGMESLTPSQQQQTVAVGPQTVKSVKNIPNKTVKSWEVLLSESSGSENESEMPRKPQIIEKFVCDKKVALREHDYCFAIYKMLKEEDKKPEQDLSEMDKILSNVALGAFEIPTQSTENVGAASTAGSKISGVADQLPVPAGSS